MSDAATYAKIFRAAARGCVTPFSVSQQQFVASPENGNYYQNYPSMGPSFSSEDIERARIFNSIADVFQKYAEADEAIKQTGPTLNELSPRQAADK